MARIFKSVILMCTGSGIGPCLYALGHMPGTTVRLIWSAPSPRQIFGKRIYDAALRHDRKAIIWDTKKDGRRPDVVGLAEDLYHETNAEAVWFISNRGLTRKVIAELRRRKVAAYALVFDA